MATDSEGRFRPLEAVAHQQAAAALVNLAKLYSTDPLAAQPAGELADEAEIAPAHRAAVHAALGAGLMQPDGDRFRPAAPFTRQEAASALCRVIKFSWDDRAAAEAK